MKFLVFDVETTGLPKRRKADVTELDNWPYIVQMSWVTYDALDMNITEIHDYIVKLPDDMSIPQESTNVHGITNEIMREKGEDIHIVLKKFERCMRESDLIVAHNISFDKTVIGAESIRNFEYNIFDTYRGDEYCTMKKSRMICNGWGKLVVLHKKLFGTEPGNLHNSLNDVYVCFRCFLKLYFNKDALVDNKFIDFTKKNVGIFHEEYRRMLTCH